MMNTMDRATFDANFRNADSRGDDQIVAPEPKYDAITASAQVRLRASGYCDVRSLTCEHHEGILVLRGRVSRYFFKQVAQEAVRNLDGVEVILNAVEVEVD